jgi:hypothetical protein
MGDIVIVMIRAVQNSRPFDLADRNRPKSAGSANARVWGWKKNLTSKGGSVWGSLNGHLQVEGFTDVH